jgi:hypothetical protein
VQLPLYLAVPPPEYAQQLKRIDEDVASRVEKLGFDRNHLIDCLHRRESTKVCGSLDQFVHCCLVIVEVNYIVSLLTNL